MLRNEALAFLKELSSNQDISPDAVSIENSKDASGFRVHIKGHNLDKQKIKDIAKKYSLETKEDTDEILVYTP